jgi:hypothetical protein
MEYENGCKPLGETAFVIWRERPAAQRLGNGWILRKRGGDRIEMGQQAADHREENAMGQSMAVAGRDVTVGHWWFLHPYRFGRRAPLRVVSEFPRNVGMIDRMP